MPAWVGHCAKHPTYTATLQPSFLIGPFTNKKTGALWEIYQLKILTNQLVCGRAWFVPSVYAAKVFCHFYNVFNFKVILVQIFAVIAFQRPQTHQWWMNSSVGSLNWICSWVQVGWLGSEGPKSGLGLHSPQPPGDEDRSSQGKSLWAEGKESCLHWHDWNFKVHFINL